MHFVSVLRACRVGSSMFPVEYYISFQMEDRVQVARKLGIPLHSELGPRISRCAQEELQWKVVHKKIFTVCGMTWPMDRSTVRKGHSFAGMFPREEELSFFLDALFPYEIDVPQFLDINIKAERLLPGCMAAETIEELKQKSPWRVGAPGTLVGSSKFVIRHRHNGEVELRVLEAFEYMRLIGYPDEAWKPLSAKFKSMGPLQMLDLFENMAGNAYSLFHFGPCQLALLSAFGRFHKDRYVEPLEEDAEAGNVQDDSSSSAES